MTDEKIARINALAKKAKTEGLTDAEKKEQQEQQLELLQQVFYQLVFRQLYMRSEPEPSGQRAIKTFSFVILN